MTTKANVIQNLSKKQIADYVRGLLVGPKEHVAAALTLQSLRSIGKTKKPKKPTKPEKKPKKPKKKEKKEKKETKKKTGLVFDREKMSANPQSQGKKVEGYWASSRDKKEDMYKGKFPWPKANKTAWPGEAAFLAKLYALQDQPRIRKVGYRGISHSRLDGSPVGNSEYQDDENKIAWPQGFGEHYVAKFHVKPSREFYNYVQSVS